MAHVSISDDDDVTGLGNGRLNALVRSWSWDTALLEQVVLRHTQWLSSVDVWWNSLTWYIQGGRGGREGREGGREGEREEEGRRGER